MKNLTVNMPLAVPHQRPPSKYASHPYPVLVDEDYFSIQIAALDIILKEIPIFGVAYDANIMPLDVTLRTLLSSKYIDDHVAYVSSIKPLSITMQEPLIRVYIDNNQSYTVTANPIEITNKVVLIQNYLSDESACKPIVTPLNITLKIKV